MKKLFTLSLMVALTLYGFSQPPQMMSYQCVVRDNSGELITKQSIGVRTSILRGSIIQTIVFQETYTPNPSTNENGLLTLQIGSGTASIGDFSKIDWSNGPYFLRTEMDPKGGTSYTLSGQNQILSVPYSLFAEKAGAATETDPVWTTASGNYYNKTNLQTSGQASVHWGNLTNIDADIEDLASDGILTGSKVGTGISADNITTGTLPLARLSGITTNQLSAAAGIVTGQITSLASSKVTGISANRVPRSNGTGLVTGTIFDNGTNVGFGGGFTPEAQLHLRNYSGPQLMIGSSNQPDLEWLFSVEPASHLSLINEKRGSPYTALYIDNNDGNIGIGTTGPTAKLEVNGQIKINGGTPAAGQVLTSNASGLATWEPVPAPTVNHIYFEVKLTTNYNWSTLGTNQKIDFSSGAMVWENQGNAFNSTTSTFTVPEDGIYSFRGAIYFNNITSGYLIYPFLKAGGKNYYGCMKNANGSQELVDINMTLYLAKGETAQLWGFVSDPNPPAVVYGNTTDDYSFTFFSGAKVR